MKESTEKIIRNISICCASLLILALVFWALTVVSDELEEVKLLTENAESPHINLDLTFVDVSNFCKAKGWDKASSISSSWDLSKKTFTCEKQTGTFFTITEKEMIDYLKESNLLEENDNPVLSSDSVKSLCSHWDLTFLSYIDGVASCKDMDSSTVDKRRYSRYDITRWKMQESLKEDATECVFKSGTYCWTSDNITALVQENINDACINFDCSNITQRKKAIEIYVYDNNLTGRLMLLPSGQ